MSSIEVNSDDSSINQHQKQYEDIAMKIWELAEVGYQEYESSKLLIDSLKGHDFEITEGVADIPTAFIAEYGTGYPTVAILGEFDALPGVSQSSSPYRENGSNENAGHACGHHLFGAGSAWTAVAVKDWMKNNNIKGTIRFYGTPAEEGGSGKVYMARSGLFDDVDIVLHGHTNKYREEVLGNTIYFNPGESAGLIEGSNALGLINLDSLEIRRIFF